MSSEGKADKNSIHKKLSIQLPHDSKCICFPCSSSPSICLPGASQTPVLRPGLLVCGQCTEQKGPSFPVPVFSLIVPPNTLHRGQVGLSLSVPPFSPLSSTTQVLLSKMNEFFPPLHTTQGCSPRRRAPALE